MTEFDRENAESRALVVRDYAFAAAAIAAALLMLTIAFQLWGSPIGDNGASDPYGDSTITALDPQYYDQVSPDGSWTLTGASDPYFNPSYPDFGSTVDGTPYYGMPLSMDDPIRVTVSGGCDQANGRYTLNISGLTSYGSYRVQTDWYKSGTYLYGDAGNASADGTGTYTWSCYDATGVLLNPGYYDVDITDNTSGFATVTPLAVGVPTGK